MLGGILVPGARQYSKLLLLQASPCQVSVVALLSHSLFICVTCHYYAGIASAGEGGEMQERPAKRSKEELRALWKTAINQQVLLIRMEKENARLRGKDSQSYFVPRLC